MWLLLLEISAAVDSSCRYVTLLRSFWMSPVLEVQTPSTSSITDPLRLHHWTKLSRPSRLPASAAHFAVICVKVKVQRCLAMFIRRYVKKDQGQTKTKRVCATRSATRHTGIRSSP